MYFLFAFYEIYDLYRKSTLLLGVCTVLAQSWGSSRRMPNEPALKLLTMFEIQPRLFEMLKVIESIFLITYQSLVIPQKIQKWQ